MANGDGRSSFPSISVKAWWELRRRFQKSVPSQVTVTYLQTVLQVQEKVAKNLLPNIRAVGLIDADGKPTELAMEWRTDAGYTAATRKMLATVYPEELKDAVPIDDPDSSRAQTWFMKERRVGEGAATQMARLYALLCRGDVTAAEASLESTKSEKPRRTKRSPAPVAKAPEAVVTSRAKSPDEGHAKSESHAPTPSQRRDPSLHIDVQVHIPSTATPEQIDAIFASMARHLYGRS